VAGQRNVMTALEDVMGLLFPAHCAGCGSMLPPGKYVCGPCAESLEPLNPDVCCPICADAIGAGVCARCSKNAPAFELVHAPLLYGGAVKDGIHRLKFGDSPWAA